MKQKILILDFGSQYTQLIARRVREQNVYCEVLPYNKFDGFDSTVKGIILSGSPFSVRQADALQIDLSKFLGKLPVLAICYGAQLIASNLGGTVSRSDKREYGKALLSKILVQNDPIFDDIQPNTQVWMSHGDTITELPKGYHLIASTDDVAVAAFRSDDSDKYPTYCLQFHPEVTHSLDGMVLISNFLFKIANCEPDWTPASFVEESIHNIRSLIGNDQVIMGLSGGVDSSVAAMMLHKAIGKQLICIFVDNGLMRKNEFSDVLHSYQDIGLNIIGVDASNMFLTALKGLSNPEDKRKAIGRVFIEVFENEAKKYDNVKWLGQGTIYPDVIESISVHGPSVTIKSHHNVGGLPEKMGLKIVEPLRNLFKDEVRKAGHELKIDPNILNRHPFPGPGLGIRVLGEITPEKVAILQEADAIFINNLKKSGLYSQVWQAATILLPVFSVGVMGDERTYEQTVALRAVNSVDGMTAEWSKLPYEFLANVSSEIINTVRGINRVVYDISTKPPSTIEWE